ncbi:MAG: hypothetical protein OP8BY_1340 [Candidatus Saccharicenans subterraneus]|uniref:Uncharacterized protein n=1 Tax=Candidatus Saccharicenans subterraneus TaxID=2508984 RepID=A0A3E2BQ06_9BACT|nr:MAG: hypothetical protein OP8BY_1340 [Candidatus Saccharicenans subterraneum]
MLRDHTASRKTQGLALKEYDIYSRDGFFLYRTKLPSGRCPVIRNSHLWATHTDEEKGPLTVKRLRIKNRDEIGALIK